MAVNVDLKFNKYVKKLENEYLTAEQILKELKENAEALQSSGIIMRLLADDFLTRRAGVCCNRIDNNTITPYHNHDFYEMVYVVKGQCAQYIEGKGLVMNEGDLIILPTEAFHAPCPVSDSICINILLRSKWLELAEKQFRVYDKNSFLSYFLSNKVYMLFTDISKKAAGKTVDILINELKKTAHYAPFDDIYCESLTTKLMVELSECDRFDTFFSGEGHNAGKESPELILQYIRDNISTVSLESVSAHFCYTGAHLSRIIKKYTGNGFAFFVATQRMLKAEQLLKKTDIPIGSIPFLVGLESKEYFSRMFKKINGITPTEYRRRFK